MHIEKEFSENNILEKCKCNYWKKIIIIKKKKKQNKKTKNVKNIHQAYLIRIEQHCDTRNTFLQTFHLISPCLEWIALFARVKQQIN